MLPHPSRLSPQHPDYAAIIAAHQRALDAGDRTYLDPRTGLTVQTSATHLERGSCCNSGCRHCPFVD